MSNFDKNFVEDYFTKLYRIYQEQDFKQNYFDVVFHVQGRELYAHSLTLAEASSVFNENFIKNHSSRNEPITIDDYSYDEFYEFLRCIYCPYKNLNIHQKNVFLIAELVEIYDVDKIKEKIYKSELFFDLNNFEEAFQIIELSYKFYQNGYRFFFYLPISELIQFDGFVHLDKFALEAFVFYASKHGVKAEELCKAVFEWGEHHAMISDDMSEKEKNEFVLNEIKNLIPIFKFEFMSSKFLLDFALKKDLISIKQVVKNSSYDYSEVSEIEEVCKEVYKLGENKAMISKEMTEKEKNQLVLNEIKDFLEDLNFKKMTIKFLFDFAIKKDLISIEEVVKNASSSDMFYRNYEEFCKAVYEWGEQQAKISEKMTEKEKNELVLNEIKDLIPFLKFEQMSIKFLEDFVVKRNLLTMDQVCKFKQKNVRIVLRSSLAFFNGLFVDDYGIYDFYLSRKTSIYLNVQNKYKASCKNQKFKIPTTQSTVEKMKGCEWYLLLENDGTLSIKHESLINKKDDYLIAELKSSNTFDFSGNNSIYLFVSHKQF